MSGVYVPGQDDNQQQGGGASDVPAVYVPGQEASTDAPKDSNEEFEDDGEAEEDGDGDYVGERATKPNKPYKKPYKKPARMSAQDAQYKNEFNMFDLDSNGSIDIKDLSKCFMGYVPDSVLQKAIAVLDTNKDGKISFAEYKTVRKMMGNIKMPSKTTGKK